MKLKPWTKLQKQLYNLISDEIDFQIHCSAYPMHSQRGSIDMPRYWITLGNEIIWDYPGDFIHNGKPEEWLSDYPYINDVSDISDFLREYIDTPKNELFTRHFGNDRWGLADILRAADFRIGDNRLRKLQKVTINQAAIKIIAYRLKKNYMSNKNIL